MRPETRKHLESVGADEEQFVKALRVVFPHGHEDFLPTTIAEMELHSVKNHDYAKGGDSLGNFNRVAAILALYPGLDLSDRRVVALAYALKQLDAVLWGLCKKIAHKVEGINERLGDISIYAKIVMCMNIENARNAEIDRQFAQDKEMRAVEEKLKQDERSRMARQLREEADRIESRVCVSAAGRFEDQCKDGSQLNKVNPVPSRGSFAGLDETRAYKALTEPASAREATPGEIARARCCPELNETR
jgi:hypothetical protein